MSEAAASRWQRDPDHGIAGGVCAGIARALGVDVVLIRGVAVVITIATGGIAILAYLLAWGLMPASGQRTRAREEKPRRRRGSWRIAAGFALLALSLLLAFRQLGIWWSDALIWPLVLATFGLALLWSLTRPRPETEPVEPESPRERIELEAEDRRETARRLSLAGFGGALVLGAGLLFLLANGFLTGVGDTALAALVVIAAVALILAPLWVGLARRLTAERSARIRSQERAELGAHLHDSVLQTLAVMQRRADDPAEVERLARRQERELRTWLARGEAARPGERLADALRSAAEQVEDTHGTAVEAVVVGDAPLNSDLEALVAASREALTNAAKFGAGGGPVRLYAEIENGSASVYVDDRGPGFDPAKIPGDRRGVRESIVGRMKRHGGKAKISSEPGAGTEVELKMGTGG